METVKVGGKWYAIAIPVAQRVRRIVAAYHRMKRERDEAIADRDEARANVHLLAIQLQGLEQERRVNEDVIDELLAMEETHEAG
jgi:hypothetical protein